MTSWIVLQLGLFTVAALLVVLSAATFVQRIARSRAQAQRSQRESLVRPRLMRLLTDDEPDLESLDRLDARELAVVESLVWQLLTKVRGSTRASLVSWLEHRGAIDSARRATHSRSVVRRATAAEKLGDAGIAETSPDVIRLLGDRNVEVRIVAARALGKLGDKRAVPALLGAMTGAGAVPTSIVSMSLLHVGPTAIDGLVAGLASRSAAVRAVSVELLGMHGAMNSERSITLMADDDPDLDVRIGAVNALGRIGVPRSVEVLSRAASPDEPIELRVAAARALGLVGGTSAVTTLRDLLAVDNEELGFVAAEALAASGEVGIASLEAATVGVGALAARAQDCMSRVELGASSRRVRRITSRNIAPVEAHNRTGR